MSAVIKQLSIQSSVLFFWIPQLVVNDPADRLMQAESKTCVDRNAATQLAVDEQIGRNLPSHHRIDRGLAAQDMSTHQLH